MSYEDIQCQVCKRVGQNVVESFPVENHPNVEEKWLICKCGHDIMEVEE